MGERSRQSPATPGRRQEETGRLGRLTIGLTSDAKAQLAATIRSLRAYPLADPKDPDDRGALHAALETAYRLSRRLEAVKEFRPGPSAKLARNLVKDR